MTETVSSRSSRNRRVVALMGWGCLVATAFFLWNARQTGSVRTAAAEPVAFILAAFAAFVGVFAWMLFNPGRRSAAESPSLFFAAAATLFPPPIIGFCLMPIDSPLRGWLALGLFLLCVIAVLSHVPDEFFGVPRGRHTYLTPIPAFDRVEGTVLDPNASWFTFEDLSRIVSDRERPSLAPRAYLQRDTVRVTSPTRTEIRPVSEVDDILGLDFELGLLDDSPIEDSPVETDRPLSTQRTLNRQVGRAESTPAAPASNQGSTSEYIAGTATRSATNRLQLPTARQASTDSSITGESRRESYRRHEQPRRETEHELRVETPPQRFHDTSTAPVPERRMSESVPDAIPDSYRSVAPVQGFLERPQQTAEPLADNTVQRSRIETREAARTDNDRPARQSRYDETHRHDSRQPQTEQPGPLSEPTRSAAPQQQHKAFQRTKDKAGSELVEGVMKVHFDQGQKRANIHVPFSPPLAGMPEVECECVGGESLRLKVPVRQSYGIRIEARRSNADEPLDADIGFAAVCTAE